MAYSFREDRRVGTLCCLSATSEAVIKNLRPGQIHMEWHANSKSQPLIESQMFRPIKRRIGDDIKVCSHYQQDEKA